MNVLKLAALTVALIAVAVLASPAKADPYSWTGPYAGISVGGDWANATVRDTTGGVTPGPFRYSPSGFLGGGLAGYNYQLGALVIGVEGDVGYMSFGGKGYVPSSTPGQHQDLTLDNGFYADITGRAGILIDPTTLVFVKGGFAYLDSSASQQSTKAGYVANGTSAFTGWTVGAGAEHMVTENISLKLEWQHFDFGTQGGNQVSHIEDPVGYVYKNTTDLTTEVVKASVVYHF
jgi:outer membrane immunogenic protein